MTRQGEIRPGYKQTEVGVIPEDWEVKPLLETVRIASGQVDPKIEPFRSMPLVAPDHIEGYTGKLLCVRTAEEQRAISGKYLFAPGDVIYSKIRPYLRKAILADFEGLCSADMYPLTPTKSTSGGYILVNLLDHRFSKFAEAASIRSGMPKINRAELAEFVLPVPPLPEQRAIAAALADADALIAALEGMISKKRDLKQAAMQHLLTGKTRLPGFSGEWEVKLLGDLERSRLIQLGRGKVISKLDIDREPGDNPIYSSSVQFSGLFGRYRRYMFDEEMITWSVDGGGHFFYRPKHKFSVTNVCGYMRVEKSAINCRFLASQLQFLHSKLKFDYQDKAHPSVIRKAYTLALPSIGEQTAIAEVLSDMDADLAALEAQASKARAVKQGMMQELLTGRVRLE